MVPPGTHRYSCAYFTVPAWDAVVRPLLPHITSVTQQPAAAAPAAALEAQDGMKSAAAALDSSAGPSKAAAVIAEAAAGAAADNPQQGDVDLSTAGAVPAGPATGQPDSASSHGGGTGDGGTSSSGGGGFSVDSNGVMVLGSEGVRVLDYITAKYQWHFADAGAGADATGKEDQQAH